MAIISDSGFDREYGMRELRRRLPMTLRSQGSYTGGPTAGQFGLMSQTMPTAEEQAALTNRNIARAQYGRYGRGGLERERIAADTGIKREGLQSAEKVAGIHEQGATGRTKMDVDQKSKEADMRYHPGDAFTPMGTERIGAGERKAYYEALAEEARSKGDKAPKVFQEKGYNDKGVEQTTYQMPVYDPQTGQYVMQALPSRSGLAGAGQLQNGLYNPETDTAVMQQQPYNPQQGKGLTQMQPMAGQGGNGLKAWFDALSPEEQEYWRTQWQQRNSR